MALVDDVLKIAREILQAEAGRSDVRLRIEELQREDDSMSRHIESKQEELEAMIGSGSAGKPASRGIGAGSKPGSLGHRILQFLAQNDKQAFGPKDIADRLNAEISHVYAQLSRLSAAKKIMRDDKKYRALPLLLRSSSVAFDPARMPQSLDAERAVLGSILIRNHAFDRVIETINTEDFFSDANRMIFATMRRLAEQSREIDPLTLREELAKNGQLEQVGGSAYIASLVDDIPDIANVERYALIVKEKSTLRAQIAMGNSMLRTREWQEGDDELIEGGDIA
ncbi:MAG TPA: DnaB-like helicase N-terminal domain-containing protein [Thermoanaerobaculia bacterium]|nr:DnaB-like helicase N-terminal domain-containing protein [Thermoanaerobaculia bacterium]